MHGFMGRALTIADNPAIKDMQQCYPGIIFDHSLPSRLLNRQIKHAMHLLLQEKTREVLVELEKQLRTRSTQSWASCFCAFLILCFCIEELQVALDGFNVHNITKKSVAEAPFKGLGIEPSQKLEVFFRDLKTIFHEIYRSNKGIAANKINERGFNPIRDGVEIDEMEELSKGTRQLVKDIHKILDTYGRVFGIRSDHTSY